ncbi:hypothetical protein WG78_08770 [Amantichitinum ursilacus]|uniref:Uncharacterized protein n=1 Tax=Amantichitinum ursilacus TaxID=857265 RepID=A0A0N0XJ11_9NEIS|nr:hypothetical protein WG78_08770 [Amantichitinum ursilacus]
MSLISAVDFGLDRRGTEKLAGIAEVLGFMIRSGV